MGYYAYQRVPDTDTGTATATATTRWYFFSHASSAARRYSTRTVLFVPAVYAPRSTLATRARAHGHYLSPPYRTRGTGSGCPREPRLVRSRLDHKWLGLRGILTGKAGSSMFAVGYGSAWNNWALVLYWYVHWHSAACEPNALTPRIPWH
jgi:hypothetical protein